MAYKVFAQDVAAPFSHICFFTMANQSDKAEKILGTAVKPALQEITNFNVRWCLEEKNFLIQVNNILEKLESHNFYKRLIEKSYSSLGKFKNKAFKIKKLDYSCFTLSEIARILDQFLKTWIEATIWGVIVNHSDFRFELLSQKVTSIIEKKVVQLKTQISPVEAFALLTTPTKRSLVIQQEIELLKILREIQENKRLKKTKLLKKEINNFSWLYQKIKQHKEKYDWLQYGYIGPNILDENYFIKVLEGLQKQGIKAGEKIREIINKEKETKRQQKKLKNKLKFTLDELYWIEMAKEFAYLKGCRKEITFIASRALFPLLSEVSNRFNLSFKQVIQMSVDEIFRALKNKIVPPARLLNKRIKYCLIYYPKVKQMVYVGVKAQKLAKKIVEEKIEKEIKEIKGTIAYQGKVRGVVKLIFVPKDIGKMGLGNILVSPATNPNIMPAITKAGAIITDEGGIVCHAAIVSRELKIPCVIGTKIATKVLKDGQLVEVDANKGVVRIIK